MGRYARNGSMWFDGTERWLMLGRSRFVRHLWKGTAKGEHSNLSCGAFSKVVYYYIRINYACY